MSTLRKGLSLAVYLLAMAGGISGGRSSAATDLDRAVQTNCRWAAAAFSDHPGPPPFSFVYNGKKSAELIGRWQRRVNETAIERGRRLRTLVLTDPDTQLEVRAVVTIYTDTPGVDWTLYFTNRAGKETPVIEQVKAVDSAVSAVKPEAAVVLHRLNGSPCRADDWLPFDQTLSAGQSIDFAATAGRSSNVCPFFNLSWPGGGTITAIGWSGQWSASVQRGKDGSLRVQAGMERLHVKLQPGETIRSPRILQLHWSGSDHLESYNLFRRTMLAHIMPRIDGRLVLPPIAHTSDGFYEQNATTERAVLSHLEAVKGLGFEIFWLDAYWTGPHGFPSAMGNYGFPIERVEPKDRFPRGLRAIGDAVEQAGLGFLVWFEPERVARGTLLAKEHPQWILPAGGNGGLYNLGIPAARQYMTDYLNAVIRAYKLSCLRIDYNIDPLAHWQSGDKNPDRLGMTEMRYIEGLYRMWDDIRKANPKLFIDDCASGGRRIDLETMSRSIPLWRSDNTCDMQDAKPATIFQAAIKNQVMSAGLNRYVPYSTVGQMGATPYLFRSGFNAGITFAQDVRPKSYPRELLRQAIAEGKRLRKYWLGNFYPLSPVTTSPKDWCVLQYHRPKEQDGIVVAFRRPDAPQSVFPCQLRQIESEADYSVNQSVSYQPAPPVTLKGSDLRRIEVRLDEPASSVVLEYRRIK
jgi:alpha-galactosidase